MKKTILFSVVFTIIVVIIGCDNSQSNVNYTKIDEKYKTIVIPIIKQDNILYAPVIDKYRNITVPIVKESDLQ